MRETDLLKRIYQRSAALGGGHGVVVGPGDDCAVVRVGGADLLLTVDQLIEGRHFVGPIMAGDSPSNLRGTRADLVARKAVARSVSDIAAMSGTPRWALATAALPANFPQALADELFDHFSAWALHWGCPVVGGDISATDGPAAFTLTIGGEPEPARGPVLRSGARVGDKVYVTGRLGGSFASGRHLTFEPRVKEGQWLARHLGAALHAMIDISDGLGLDGHRVGNASGARLRIAAPALPRHEGIKTWQAACADGEDHELLFVTAPGANVPPSCPLTGTVLTEIGTVVDGAPGCFLVDERGVEHDGAKAGFLHGSGSG